MSLSILRLTRFKVQRLQCIGGQGRATPYRITTYNGMELGSFGEIASPFAPASNAGTFKKVSWHRLQRLWSTFSY
jgi:hypothetical protein